MKADHRWKWINLAAFAVMVIMNALAELLPIGGMTTGEISALYPTPLTPAPVSFAIWGVIYLTLGIFILVQLIAQEKMNVTERIGPWFLVSCVANVGWIIMWHLRSMSLAMLMMVILLISLAIIEKQLRDVRESAAQRWIIRLPFGLYYGWITVATIANVSAWLRSLGFDGFGWSTTLWVSVVLLIGGTILCKGIQVNRDVAYGLAALWGYFGILLRLTSIDPLGTGYFWPIVMIAVCGVSMVFMLLNLILPEKTRCLLPAERR